MSDLSEIIVEIQTLWNEHLAEPFPASESEMIEGAVDLHELDTYIAGCVSTFTDIGNLDTGRTAILGLCYRDTLVAQSVYSGEERKYSERLERLAELVLRAVVLKNKVF